MIVPEQAPTQEANLLQYWHILKPFFRHIIQGFPRFRHRLCQYWYSLCLDLFRFRHRRRQRFRHVVWRLCQYWHNGGNGYRCVGVDVAGFAFVGVVPKGAGGCSPPLPPLARRICRR